MEQAHRSGKFKQKNKIHKAPKKRSRKNSVGSFRSVRSNSSISGTRKGSGIAKVVRKNRLIQLRREEILNSRRGIIVPPILISVIDFSNNLNRFLKLLETFDPSAVVQRSMHGNLIHLDMPRIRARFEISILDRKDLFSSIDLAKISDILLMIHSADIERFELNQPESIMDDFFIIDAIYNHCLPNTIHSIIGLNGNNPKQKDHINKVINEVIEKNYPGLLGGKIFKLRSLDTAQDLLKLFYDLSVLKIKKKSSSYSGRRSQVLAEEINFFLNDSQNNPDALGTLQVDGFIRNNPLNVNSLVYIPEFGEFQMDLIETMPVPYGDEKRKLRHSNINFKMQADPSIRQSLEKENPVETIFEEEMCAMDECIRNDDNVERKKVPKGTSDYQAAWIVDSGEENDEESDDNDQSENEMDDNDSEQEIIEKINKIRFKQIDEDDAEIDSPSLDNDNDDTDGNDPQANYDQDVDMEAEKQEFDKFKEQRMYEMFPDEIDTPIDRPARERFSKYRGLKSFRTSKWDAMENLPPDYSRIFQFENFNHTRRRIFKTDPVGAENGYYVRVHLINVPKNVYDYYHSNPNKPLILFELLAHEHKMSVMNIVLRKLPTFTIPIRSKERLIFHVGYRRFAAKPIFSAHTTGDKHKYEKFLRSDMACVATIYGPITYPPASVLVYKEFVDDDGRSTSHQLVAIGSLLDCNPQRLVIKRFVLSGSPFKINRRHAVVRYMFFNREDILWFRPVELRTKYGRHGHILEPLGTHGHMKCRFDHQLASQDTVLMYLYKRVFPKWYYEPLLKQINEPKIILTNHTMIETDGIGKEIDEMIIQ